MEINLKKKTMDNKLKGLNSIKLNIKIKIG